MAGYGRYITMRASAATTSATTETGDWFDCDDMNELYVALNVTAFAARVDETLLVTIEMYSLNTDGYVTIGTFNIVNTTGAQSQHMELDSFASRIRVRAVTAGTWSSKSITWEVKAYLKKA